MSTAQIPERLAGETVEEWQQRVMSYPNHWQRCLALTKAGTLCMRSRSACSHRSPA